MDHDFEETGEAKPFHRDFDEQLDAAEELYGIQLHFNRIKQVPCFNCEKQ